MKTFPRSKMYHTNVCKTAIETQKYFVIVTSMKEN